MYLRILPLLALVPVLHAAEPVTLPHKLETLTTVGVGSRTYDGVTIVGKDAVGIRINHEGGTSRIAYEKLPADLRQRFVVDQDAAKAQLDKEAKERAGYDRAVVNGMKEENAADHDSSKIAADANGESDEAFIARITATDRPEMTGRSQAEKIVALQAYIDQLKEESKKLDETFKRRSAYYTRRMARANYSGNMRSGEISESNPRVYLDSSEKQYAALQGRLDQKHIDALELIGSKIRAAQEELSFLKRNQ